MATPHGDGAAHPFAGDPVFDLHVGGKMETVSTVSLSGSDELSIAYTPGVARVCTAIAEDPDADPALHLGAQHRRRSSPTAPPCSGSATSARPPRCR